MIALADAMQRMSGHVVAGQCHPAIDGIMLNASDSIWGEFENQRRSATTGVLM
jgi:hypothetical protein